MLTPNIPSLLTLSVTNICLILDGFSLIAVRALKKKLSFNLPYLISVGSMSPLKIAKSDLSTVLLL